MTSVPASVSPLLAPLWAGPDAGRVWPVQAIGVGDFGCYLHVPGAPVEVVPVLTSAAIALPTAVRLAMPVWPRGIRLERGMTGTLSRRGITVGACRLGFVREWAPARVAVVAAPRPVRVSEPEERRALVSNVRAALADPARVVDLVGQGDGLTPAGDDALAGALLVHRALGRSTDLRTAVLAQLARTTALSASLLRAAGQGYAAAPVVAFVMAAVTGAEDEVRRLRPAVEAIGHGSGRDLLAGVGACLSSLSHPLTLRRVS